MANLGLTVLHALWLFLPAYLANMAPVFVPRIGPIDGGRLWKDGRRILGDGKSWGGLLIAPLVAAVLILVLGWVARSTVVGRSWGFDDFGAPAVAFVMAYVMGFGALVGDAVESFFKRRKGLERGAMWLGFDQLDFVVGAFLVGLLGATLLDLAGVTDGNWLLARFELVHVLAILILTPALHLAVNYIGYRIGKKQVPW
jgi:CDP-2,3-bis-(O-geranylgeranyl)-sn-glycerol synthase